MYDVVVTGGGVAGATIAIHLARRGRSVVVVDRAAAPHRKPCGEGLFPYGVAELEALGVLNALAPYTASLRQLRFHAGDAYTVAPLGQMRPGLGIRRDLLDRVIREQAAAAGTEFRRGVTVRGFVVRAGRVAALDTSAGPIAGRAFVAADGLNSRLRRIAGLESGSKGSRYGISAHLAFEDDPGDAVDVYFHDGFEVYRTPVGGKSANVALLLEKRRMADFGGRLDGAFDDLLAAHPALAGGATRIDEPLAAGPFPQRCTRAWRANLVLAGDAAGFFDGISGDGMSSALATAPLCATAIESFLDTGAYDGFRAYEHARRAASRDAGLIAHLSLSLARRPALARVAVRNLARRPQTFARLTAVAADRASLRSLRGRDLSALALGL